MRWPFCKIKQLFIAFALVQAVFFVLLMSGGDLKTLGRHFFGWIFSIMGSRAPIFSFGVIADVQYANQEDGTNYRKTSVRYYRNSLEVVKKTVKQWNSRVPKVTSALQLGDLIDGRCKRDDSSETALETVLRELHQFEAPTYHVWGNHELYNFKRSQLEGGPIFSGEDGKMYYEVSPKSGFRFVAIDTYEISILGHDEKSKYFLQAQSILNTHNKNDDQNSPNGLVGIDGRFVAYNGAMSWKQLTWLDQVLSKATKENERVVVFGHIPLYAPAADRTCLLWNYQEVLDVFHRYNCVIAYFSGHDHEGGYAVDPHGVHHVTFEGVVETKPGDLASAVVDVYEDRLELVGEGRVPSRTLYPSGS